MTADEKCKQSAYEQLREGAWTAAASSLSDDEVQKFVADCLAEARAE